MRSRRSLTYSAAAPVLKVQNSPFRPAVNGIVFSVCTLQVPSQRSCGGDNRDHKDTLAGGLLSVASAGGVSETLIAVAAEPWRDSNPSQPPSDQNTTTTGSCAPPFAHNKKARRCPPRHRRRQHCHRARPNSAWKARGASTIPRPFGSVR